MSLSTVQLAEPQNSPLSLAKGLYDFMALQTDYFSYVPTPLDVSKPFLEPRDQHLKTQSRQRSAITSSTQFSGESDESSNAFVSNSIVSPSGSNLNPSELLLQTWPSEPNTIPNFDQPFQPAQPNEFPSNHNAISPPVPEPVTRKPRRKYRKRKVLSQEVIEQKRYNFLKRNRLAANRYREKKKDWVSELEDKQKEQKQANMGLVEEQNGLRAEIKMLKSWLSRCATCKGGIPDEISKEKTG